MKKLFLILALVLTAILLFASCGSTDIENGVIDIDDETIAALPCTVDVEGLEGVSGTVSIDLVTESAKADALSKVKEGYSVAEGATTYAVEITLKKDGEDVVPGKPITVKIGLKTHDLPLDQYTVFHIHGDRVTEIVPTVTEDSLSFSISEFSIFLVVPKHVHTPGALVVDTAATCIATGTGHIPCTVCGKTVETQTIEKTAHTPGEWINDAAAGKSYRECVVCRERIDEKPYEQPVATDNRFAGSALTYVGYNGAIYDKTAFPTSGEVNAFLSRITVSFFNDGTVDADGNVTGARFEVVSKNDDGAIGWAIFGVYSAAAKALSCEITVESYFDGATGKYYQGSKSAQFPLYFLDVSGGISINTDKGLYEVTSYVQKNGAEGGAGVAVKGSFFFRKDDAAPTHAQVPEDTNDDSYERFVENKVFTFSGASATGADVTAFNAAYSGATVQFFADNYAEIRTLKAVRAGAAVDSDLVLGGSYTIEESADGYEIVLVPAKRFLDGEETAVVGGSVTLTYDKTANTVKRAVYSDEGFAVTCTFALSAGATPTEYAAPPAPDNWDADMIAAAFRAVGATNDVTLPKLDYVKSMTKSDVVGGKVTVTIEGATTRAAREAADKYKGQTIPRAFEHTRYEGNSDYYLTAHNEAEFGVWVNETSSGVTVTIEITAFSPAYPENEISAYLVDRDVTDGIIDFRSQSAVGYVWNDGSLSVNLRKDAVASSVTKAYVDELTTAGRFTVETVSGKVLYVSENKQIVFYLSTDTSGARPVVLIGFLSPSVLPMTDYPADLIASLLEGTNDAFFNFAQENATEYRPLYHGQPDEFEGEFYIYLPADADGAAVADAIRDGFVALGYTPNDVRFGFGDEPDCRRTGLVSPDKEIAVTLNGYDARTLVDWGASDGSFCYAIVRVVNLKKVENLAWIESIKVTTNKTQYPYGFYFDGKLTVTFSNGKTEEPYLTTGEGGNFAYTLTPDDGNDGIKTVTVTYLGRFTDSYEIYLGEPDMIREITTTGYTTIWYQNDVWTFDGTLTATWTKSGTQPLSVDDVYFYPAAPDMTSLGSKHVTVTLKTDETVSASVNFTVRSRTTVYTFVNNDEWDVFADGAKFAVYAIGGDTYGAGTWVETDVLQSRKRFSITLDKDAASFRFVRLTADADVINSDAGLDDECVLNVSEAITLPLSGGAGGTVPTFSFGEP